MSDRWIVSGYKFVQHCALEIAQKEAERLREKTNRDFRVYRIKDTLAAGLTSTKIADLTEHVERAEAQRDAAVEVLRNALAEHEIITAHARTPMIRIGATQRGVLPLRLRPLSQEETNHGHV